MTPDLDADLLAAHARHDGPLLALLYARAADAALADGQTDRACFFLTHAYVFALEAGVSAAAEYNQRLAAHGRDVLRYDLAEPMKATA